MMPQRERGPSKYFDDVTDLIDFDDDMNRRIRPDDPSDSDEEGSRDKYDLPVRQISSIVDWNGAKPKNDNSKNKNNYIIEQWEEESENLDMIIGKENPADAVGLEVYAVGLDPNNDI